MISIDDRKDDENNNGNEGLVVRDLLDNLPREPCLVITKTTCGNQPKRAVYSFCFSFILCLALSSVLPAAFLSAFRAACFDCIAGILSIVAVCLQVVYMRNLG